MIDRLTAPQLDALAALTRMQPGPSLHAAGLVLVEGRRQADAAREAGLSPSALGNALRRLRRAEVLARQASGLESRSGHVEPVLDHDREARRDGVLSAPRRGRLPG